MKINILPPNVYNLLSAGEVVENPSAIVKECVENSIDAHATKVEIDIERGGLDMIRIVDDGHGVEHDEVENVFAPHATSKISNAKDLENIATLGFRGEAMASISAVAHVDFKTCVEGVKTGTHLRIEGGKIVSKKPIARAKGTEVTVRNLFYNTPARAKFLHPANVEKNAVTNVVARIILSNPTLNLTYKIDGDILYDYNGKTPQDAIKAVYADIKDDDLIAIRKFNDEFTVSGYVGVPTFTKRNRTYQTVLVNNRPVEGGIIADAVNEAFTNYMTTGNFPFFVLYIEVKPTDIDVNVHPRKSQVKFSQSDRIQKFVNETVNEALDRYLQIKNAINYNPREDEEMLKRISSINNDDNQKVQTADNIMNMFDMREQPTVPRVTPKLEQLKMVAEELSKFRILGTIFSTYILIEDDRQFHIIDQHAGCERILFDRLSKQIDTNAVEKQRLLEPEVLMLSPTEMTKMEGAVDILNKCGIECAPFGHNVFRITAVPAIVARHGVGVMLDAILGEVKISRLSDLLRDKIISQCCHASVKAGMELSHNEIKNLVSDLVTNKTTPTCPHGRPIIKSFTRDDIEKMFARK